MAVGLRFKYHATITPSSEEIVSTRQTGTGSGLEDCFGRLRVEANRIALRPERFGTGINARECNGKGERMLFANNVVTVIDGDTLTAVTGIFFSDIIAARLLP